MKKMRIVMLIMVFCLSLFAAEVQTEMNENIAIIDSVQTTKITFLEFGSTTCIPCQQMEKVLDVVREKYSDQIKVTFYDVKKHKKIAAKYKIRMIPTQVFLDASGKEIHRHVGFYPEEKIDEFLRKQGLKIIFKRLEE